MGDIARFLDTVLCLIWPSHKLIRRERLSPQTERLQCMRCGRQYAVNHDVQSLMPWRDAEAFYRERPYLKEGQ